MGAEPRPKAWLQVPGSAFLSGIATNYPPGRREMLLDRSLESLSEVARETGGLAVAADVTEEGSVAQAVEQGAAAMGGIDGVVNAARGHAP